MATYLTRHNTAMNDDTSKYRVLFLDSLSTRDGWKCGWGSVNLQFKPAYRTYNDYLALCANGLSRISAQSAKINKGA